MALHGTLVIRVINGNHCGFDGSRIFPMALTDWQWHQSGLKFGGDCRPGSENWTGSYVGPKSSTDGAL